MRALIIILTKSNEKLCNYLTYTTSKATRLQQTQYFYKAGMHAKSIVHRKLIINLCNNKYSDTIQHRKYVTN